MKKHILITISVNALLYTAVYFFIAFVNWELYNPFKWIIDIPNYGSGERAAILIILVCLHIIEYMVISDYLKRNKTKSR